MRHPELGLHYFSGALRHHGIQPRADAAEGDALVLSALEIIARFDPLMWVIENPATGLLKTGLQGEAFARLMEGQYERVSQSRELLYSVPAALCEEIARAATEELAERLSIPD